jgi:hypothetical protein
MQNWVKFNDENVEFANEEVAFDHSYGGCIKYPMI